MKKTILTLCLSIMAMVVMAVPAKRGLWQNLKMSDGTTVRAELCGDEHLHFWQTEAGERLVREGETFVRVDDATLQRRSMLRRARKTTARLSAPRRVNIGERTHYTGKKKGIVILAQFKDVKFKSANNLAKYKRILNEAGYTTSEGFKGSVCDYFKDQSQGQFELDFDVVGPYTMNDNRSKYGDNDSDGNDKNAEAVIVASCKAADAEVNFKDYDWDNDGYVDQVFVLYAGTGEADSYDEDAIWPHMYELSATNRSLSLDGVTIDTYACSNEVDMSGNIEGIGCFCHEFSHCMGFPDFYDTSYSGWFGLSRFDLMDQGSYNGNAFVPAGYSAHEKMMCGWLEPIELSDEDVTIENLKSISEGGESYIIYNKAHPDEYYMIENRQKKGWDAKLPARGLMITHVDFDKDIWMDNTPNTLVTTSDMRAYGYSKTNDHERCTIFHADNDDDSKYWSSSKQTYSKTTLGADLYPQANNNCLTNTSTPAATLYNKNTDGKKFMNRRILDITQNADGTVTFSYKATAADDPGPGPDPQPTGDVLFYESFDQCQGTGGNDGQWGGGIASGRFTTDTEGWTGEKTFGADQCAKFGTSSVAGTATTPSFTLQGEATLSFRAGAWDAKSDGTNLSVTLSGGTVTPATFTMTKGEWTDYTAQLTGRGSVKLTFSTTNGRFFLDEVRVTAVADGIEGIMENEDGQSSIFNLQSTIYDLSGHIVSPFTLQSSPLRKGIYIKNGKKIVVK